MLEQHHTNSNKTRSAKNFVDAVATYRRRLANTLKPVFNEDACPGELLASMQALASLFAKLSCFELEAEDRDATTETLLDSGKAIAPSDAARCLLDYSRTTQFVRGIDAALRALQQRFPGQVIEVLYAGCGPYATLVVPLFTRFPPGEVRFTFLDIHERSLDAAQALVNRLGYAEFVRDYIQCDASRYQWPAETPLHMVISETMQKTLDKEPQLAIMANLAPQLLDGGLFIPQRINIDLCLGDLRKEFTLQPAGSDETAITAPQRDRLMIANVMEVTQSSAVELYNTAAATPGRQLAQLDLPAIPADRHYQAMLLTRINVYAAYWLNDYDSGLTIPTVLHELGEVRGGESLVFSYNVGNEPGIRYHASRP